MPRKTLPVYNIENFQKPLHEKDFYASGLKDHLRHHHFVEEPHKHDFFLSVLFTKGSGTHQIDFVTYSIKPGSVFFLSPGQTHNWKLSADIDGFIFFHSKDFFDVNFKSKRLRDFPFFSSSANSPVVLLRTESIPKIKTLFQEILSEFKSEELMKEAKLCALTKLVYIELSRFYLPKNQAEAHNQNYLDKIKKLEELIDKNYLEQKSPSFYAGKMNVTEKHLNRICRTCLNKTTGDFITERVILEAKNLLVHTSLSVKEISGKLNFNDNAYFSRVFKKSTGLTPLGFVRKVKRKQ